MHTSHRLRIATVYDADGIAAAGGIMFYPSFGLCFFRYFREIGVRLTLRPANRC